MWLSSRWTLQAEDEMDILFVEDEDAIREEIGEFLEKQLKHRVTYCPDGQQALELFRQNPFHMVLSDIRMPGMDGIELLNILKSSPQGKQTDVVLITGHGDMQNAIAAFRGGACDYLLKPIDMDELVAVTVRIDEHQRLIRQNLELSSKVEKLTEANLQTESRLMKLQSAYAEVMGIGRIGIFSQAMREVVQMAERLHEDPSIPVLIEGETGTGKEIIARLVHYGNGEVTSPLISINCSAIPPTLFESELFGYESGAFTGARKEGSMGKLEGASKGTLLLDEIGDLPLEMQPKLLRVLQEREFYRVGGIEKIDVDARIIGATNRNLADLVEHGAFRRDLFYRLNMARIHIPPLRERREAIVPLAQMFLEMYSRQKKRSFRIFQDDALQILESYDWPGNVRELQNLVEMVVLFCDDEQVRPEHLQFVTNDTGSKSGGRLQLFDPAGMELPEENLHLSELETTVIHKALAKHEGNRTRTAAYLGISRSTLLRKLKKI